MRFVKKIPPTDRELSSSLMSDGWKKIKEPTTLFYAILCSIPFMAVNVIITYLVIKPFYDPITEIIKRQAINIEINILGVSTGLVLFFLLLVIHELLHAIFIPNFIQSDQSYWGFSINGVFVSTIQKLTKANYVVISIAPFILISVILPLIFGLLGLMNGLIFFLISFNAMASSVDILNLILILFQVPPKSVIINNGFETYYRGVIQHAADMRAFCDAKGVHLMIRRGNKMNDVFNKPILSKKKAQIVYFSGTGGTARVSSQFEKSLISHGVEVQKIALDMQEADYHTLSKSGQSADLLILIFAVHAFDAPEPVYDWLSTIPDGNEQAVAIISVSGGGEVWPNTACRVGSINVFEQKGYNVFYERMIIMPSNIFVATKEQFAIRLLQILPSKVENCVSEILSGVRRRKRAHITSRIMTAIFKLEKKGVKKFPKKVLQVGENCTSCGWCTKNCPRKNIELINSRPSFGEQCIACLRCIYGCPAKAIYTSRFSFITIKEGYNLDELEKRMRDIELEPIEKVASGILFVGVRNYLLDKDI